MELRGLIAIKLGCGKEIARNQRAKPPRPGAIRAPAPETRLLIQIMCFWRQALKLTMGCKKDA